MNPHPSDATNKLEKLEKFFQAIAYLTLNHDIIDESACVTADKLGKELEKVNMDWWKHVIPPKN